MLLPGSEPPWPRQTPARPLETRARVTFVWGSSKALTLWDLENPSKTAAGSSANSAHKLAPKPRARVQLPGGSPLARGFGSEVSEDWTSAITCPAWHCLPPSRCSRCGLKCPESTSPGAGRSVMPRVKCSPGPRGRRGTRFTASEAPRTRVRHATSAESALWRGFGGQGRRRPSCGVGEGTFAGRGVGGPPRSATEPLSLSPVSAVSGEEHGEQQACGAPGDVSERAQRPCGYLAPRLLRGGLWEGQNARAESVCSPT